MDIKKKLQQTPTSPGVYIMKAAREKVIYVGKAKNLRSRLRSYFQNSSALDERKAKMVQEIRDYDYVVTGNELEALILEANYIKRVKPKYNIILRDDKNFPYLKMTVNEEWPRLEVVRRIEKDGARYFGPYVPAGAMWEMLNFIRRTFPIRICKYRMDKPFRPCVQYQMGRCPAPCSESLRTKADHDKYLETVQEVISFVLGEKKELLGSLMNRMQHYSGEMRYEEAAKIRDRVQSLEKAWQSQRVISPELGDRDVIGLFRQNGEASVFMLFIRNGTIIGQKDFFFKKLGDMENEELISSFIGQFYSKELLLPPNIIVPLKADLTTQKKWLTEKRGKPVRLVYGKSGLNGKVLKMADENALYSYNKHKDRKTDETLLKIKQLLHLKGLPGKIGAVDISTTSGSEAVGALVVYEDGNFTKDDYRLFRIKTVEGMDDFAMIEEVMGRYLGKMADDEDHLPGLILIDGGRGQLQAALKALKKFALPVEMAAIAKARDEAPGKKSGIRRDIERVYLPGRRDPVYLDPFLPSTHVLQKIRDEVHRFALQYHRKLRKKRILESPLEKIRGIGKTRRLLLLKHFGSIDGIRRASTDEIASLKGMNGKVAGDVKAALDAGTGA